MNQKLQQQPKLRCVAYIVSTIDGYISKDKKSKVDWTSKEDWKFFQNSLAKVDAVVVGSNTYKIAKNNLKKRNAVVLTSKVRKLKIDGKTTFLNPKNSDLKNFGENHPNIAAHRNNLGVAWNAKGEHDKAIEYLEKALKSDLKTFGENHSNVATYRNNLGTALNAKGEYDKAIEHLEKALSVIQVRLGNDHPDTQTLKTNLRLAKEEKPK